MITIRRLIGIKEEALGAVVRHVQQARVGTAGACLRVLPFCERGSPRAAGGARTGPPRGGGAHGCVPKRLATGAEDAHVAPHVQPPEAVFEVL